MKATHHPVVHLSVHPALNGRCEERQGCALRDFFLGAGKTPDWAGATPLFGLAAAQNVFGVAPAQPCLPASGKIQNRGEHMPVINKPPQIKERKYQLEDLVAGAAEQYAGWIGSTSDHVVNSAVKMMLWRDKSFLAWRKSQDAARKNGQSPKPAAKA